MKFLPFLTLAFFVSPEKMEPLRLTVSNVSPEKGGQICVAIYTSENGFLKPEMVFKTLKKKVGKGQETVVFELDLTENEVALAVFQDENMDEKLSTNWVGIPSEAYGFSNNVRPKFRAATWAEAKIDRSKTSGDLEIRIENW